MNFPIKKVLICGLGSIGKKHLNILHKYWPTKQIGVYRSGYGEKCSEEKLASKIFKSLDEAINWEPDVAIIASPASEHIQQAILLANNSIHLLIEKPLGIGNEKEKDIEMLKILSKKVVIRVGYVLRHENGFKILLDLIKSDYIGNIVSANIYCGSWLPEWRKNTDYRNSVSSRKDLGGGVLRELSHEIDLILAIFGNSTITHAISNKSGTLEIDVDESITFLAKNSKNILISTQLDFCTFPSRRIINIRGTNGDIVWDLIENKLTVQSRDFQKKEMYFSSKKDDKYFIQLKDFFDSCEKNKIDPLYLNNSIQVIELINQAESLLQK